MMTAAILCETHMLVVLESIGKMIALFPYPAATPVSIPTAVTRGHEDVVIRVANARRTMRRSSVGPIMRPTESDNRREAA